MSKWFLALVCVVVVGGMAIGQGAPGGDDYLDMGLRQAQRCRQRGWHAEAIPIYRQLLNSDLDLKDRIRVHVMLADC